MSSEEYEIVRMFCREIETITHSQTFLTGVGDTPTHQSPPVTTRQEVLVQILSLYQNEKEERVTLVRLWAAT